MYNQTNHGSTAYTTEQPDVTELKCLLNYLKVTEYISHFEELDFSLLPDQFMCHVKRLVGTSFVDISDIYFGTGLPILRCTKTCINIAISCITINLHCKYFK